MIMKQGFVLLLLSLILFSCVEIKQDFDKLPPGIWRGELILESKNFTPGIKDEEVITGTDKLDDANLPFNFEITYDENKNMIFYFFNGEERIQVKEVEHGIDGRSAVDTFRVYFPEYGSHIAAKYESNGMTGVFAIPDKNNYTIPFTAKYGEDFRFTPLTKKPEWDMNGKWECTFEEGTEDEYKAVGEFNQKGNELTGTFRTETGDYRFLEGTVQGNKAFLSVFDGTHAFLFSIKMIDQDNIIGSFKSGKHYKSTWSGKRNNNFELKDPSDLTYLTEENPTIDFDFTGINGEQLSINDDIYKDKVKIVSIMGTWCPNCKDEMIFLNDVKSKYKDEIEIMAVGFERPKEKEKALKTLAQYSEKMNLDFPIVYGGALSKQLASETFPFLNKIISFPTLMIITKDNKVKYIHTGFNGPATSKYEGFIKEFHSELENTLAES